MNSFAYALDRLKKFNRFVAETPELRSFFITEKFNYLQVFQANLLFDFKYYYERNQVRAVHQIPELTETGENKSSLAKHLLALLVSSAAILKMLLRRPKVAVVSVDKISSKYQSDFRMEGVYDYLKKNHIPFSEIMHTIVGGHLKKFLLARRRAVLYLETPDAIFKLLGLMGLVDRSHPNIAKIDFSIFGEEEKVFRQYLKKYLFLRQQRCFRIKFLKIIFGLSSLKTILTIDDPRHYHDITHAAQLSGIKVYAFQHGAFGKYTAGWIYCGYGRESIAKPDRLFVWGKYWKDELLRLGTYFNEEELGFGGNPKNLEHSRVVPEEPMADSVIRVLFPYEIEAPKNQVTEFIYKVLACPNAEVIFKVRSDASAKSQLVAYGLKEIMPDNFKVVTNLSAHDMAQVDLVVGTHSTYLYEVLDYLVPVYILKTDLDYAEGIVATGLADEMDPTGDVCATIKAAVGISREVLIHRRDKFYEDYGSLEQTLHKLLK